MSHLDESQRAMCAARIAKMPQGARTDLQPSANLQNVSQAAAAAMLNVSTRSVASAGNPAASKSTRPKSRADTGAGDTLEAEGGENPPPNALDALAFAPELARRAALGDFSPDVQEWLAEAFRRHLIGGTAIETALRLDRASRLKARDDALRRAAALLMLDDGAWPCAKRLALAVAHHERKRGTPATPLECAVAQAFAAGLAVPGTARQLYEITR